MAAMRKWIVMFALFMAVLGFGVFHTETEASAETVRYWGEKYDLYTSGDFEYIVITKSSYDESTIPKSAAIVKYNGTAASVAIPDTLAGLPVAEVGYKNTNLYNDDINNCAGAFEGNSALQTVTFPSSVKVVLRKAFYNCSGLQQVLFAEGIQYIGLRAFYNCDALQRVQFQGNSLQEIDDLGFAYCSALDGFTFPSSLKVIDWMAFCHCTSLSSIVIPDSVTKLGGGAFYACTALKSADIGDGVEALDGASDNGNNRGNYAENYDGKVQGAFENCTSLTSVTLGNSLISLGTDSFANTAIVDVVIPDTVIQVWQGAFYDCDALKSLQFGKGVKEIYERACYHCNALESVTFEKKVQSIGDCAFAFDSSLQEITIPSSVETLGGGVFYGCSSMQKAVVGNGVTSLPAYNCWWKWNSGNYNEDRAGMFENCTSLKEIALGDGLTSIGMDAFANTALETVTIPGGVITIYEGAFINCKSLVSVDISDSVITIGDDSFRYDTSLKNISIGKGVTTIGSFAFANCTSLPSLLIPSNVTSLGAAVCYADALLSKAIVGNGVTDLLSWQWGGHGGGNYSNDYTGSFENCNALADVALGSGLTSIALDTFASTSISSLLIPFKVSSVGSGAFYNASLKTLYFTGEAPSLGKSLFGSSSTPETFKLAGKSGYDTTDYAFTDFTPVTVTYGTNNSSVFAILPNDQYLAPEGGYVIEPIDPAAIGYRFLGWYADSACTKAWDFLNDYVTADTTIYAKWAAVNEIAPEAPTNLTGVTSTGSAITLSWDAMEGAEGYLVYVDGELVTASAVKETTYKVSNLEADTAYEITVVATNAAGASAQSLVKVIWTAEADEILLGDVDGNGEIEAADALSVLKFVVKLSTPTDAQKEAADVSKNGKIEADDALFILKYVVKLISSF